MEDAKDIVFSMAIETIVFVLALTAIIAISVRCSTIVTLIAEKNGEKTTFVEHNLSALATEDTDPAVKRTGYTNSNTGEHYYDGTFSGAEVFSAILSADGSYRITIGKHALSMYTYTRYVGGVRQTYENELEYYQIEKSDGLMNYINIDKTYIREIELDEKGCLTSVTYKAL